MLALLGMISLECKLRIRGIYPRAIQFKMRPQLKLSLGDDIQQMDYTQKMDTRAPTVTVFRIQFLSEDGKKVRARKYNL